MKQIYIINYWTSEHYEYNVWDKYYCQSLRSTVKKIKELLDWEWRLYKKQIHSNAMRIQEYFWPTNFNNRNLNLYINIDWEPRYINIYIDNLL